ncbi:signal recognition particle-docking protein FtsY [uncultured Desulfuromusa sp.]|uniref:signal recognition particle-docking protein FtsY n=1 Tax=uncultured Desulfuromusa sp. TaxID=219183 RepID=UPI00374A011D
MEWFNLLNWDNAMQWLNTFIAGLLPLLESAGVPEEYRSLAAFGIIYLGVTAVVLLFVLVLLKIFRRRSKSPREDATVEEDSSAVVETPVDIVESEDVTEAESQPEVERERVAEPVPEPTLGIFERFKAGLSKTQSSLVGRVDSLLRGRTAIDADLIEELEEILITADLGMQTTQQLIESLESSRTKGELASPDQVRQLLMDELAKILSFDSKPLDVSSASPFVIMVVGVNGVGKTTTIGKLAHQFVQEGKKVVLGAGDTFRAAAAEQLQIWGERADVEVVSHAEGADPSAVAFDAAKAAVARKADILLLDTAGRLHTKVNLMEELKKIRRVLDREIPGAPHEVLLVLDATTGQNALTQAKLFNEAVDLDGIALTKLDGTAKGGIVVAIAAELQVPVRFVGIGEQLDDLRPFDAEMFVSVLFDR